VLRRGASAMFGAVVVLAITGASAAVASAAGPYTCSGKLRAPGVLKGTYPNGVVAKGVCAVKSGKAHVIGTLTVTKGAVLGAAFGRHHSSLTVTGNLVVERGGVVFLGCKANPDGTGFPCIDEPSMKHPTLTSHEVVSGNIVEHSPLGVIVHNSSIGGNIKETGGGGGLGCTPPKRGVFGAIMSPVFSDYEDSSVGGNLAISGMHSCWLGVARVKIRHNLTITNNVMGDPDAIEVVTNHISKNLSCSGNSHPGGGPPGAGALPIWDSVDTSPNGLYPRASKPNTVDGTRSGQCVTASPTTMGGPPAAPAF